MTTDTNTDNTSLLDALNDWKENDCEANSTVLATKIMEFAEQYRPRVEGLLRHFNLHRRFDAEDIFQEAFIEFMRTAKSVQAPEAVLATILKRRILTKAEYAYADKRDSNRTHLACDLIPDGGPDFFDTYYRPVPANKESIANDPGDPNRYGIDLNWLKTLDREDRAGVLLRSLNLQTTLTQDELGKALGVDGTVVSSWECARTQIAPEALPLIQKLFNLNEDDYRLLVVCRFPALDPAWLSNKPENKRAGILLKTYRERACLNQEELGMAIIGEERKRTRIDNWECGRSPIDGKVFPRIKTALDLTDEEYTSLVLARWPCLDYTRLAAENEENRAGILTRTFRERAGLEQKDLAAILGYARNTVSNWENGASPIPAAELLIDIFSEAEALLPDPRFNPPSFRAACNATNEALDKHKPIKADSVNLGVVLAPGKQHRAGLRTESAAQADRRPG